MRWLVIRVGLNRRALRALVGLALVAVFLAAAPTAQAIDAQVAGVHVTQGTQDPSNSVRLVSHRRTAVRASIVGDSGPPQDVVGRLHVVVNGVRITTTGGLQPLNELSSPPQLYDVPASHPGDLTFEDGTMNFELPPSVLIQLQPPAPLMTAPTFFFVEIFAPGDPNQDNDLGVGVGQLIRQIPTTVFHLRVNHTPSSTPLPDQSFIRRGTGDAFLGATLPLDDICPACLYRQGGGDLTYDRDANDDGVIEFTQADDDDDGEKLLDTLAEMRPLIVNDTSIDFFTANPAPKFLFAWVNRGAFDAGHAGRADWTGVAYGTDNPRTGQMAMAHEIAHEFRLLDQDEHPETVVNGIPTSHWPGQQPIAPSLGWDVGARLEGNPLDNSFTGRLRGSDLNDILSPLIASGGNWIGKETTDDVLNSDFLTGARRSPRVCRGGTLVLGGNIRAGSLNAKAVQLRGFIGWTYDWCTGAFLPDPDRSAREPGPAHAAAAGERFRAVVRVRGRRGSRTVRAPFDAVELANQHHLGKEGPAMPGRFQLSIALLAGERVESARIEDRQGTSRLPTLSRSRKRPAIRLRSPSRGASLQNSFTLRWSATDADARSSTLRYQVVYSPNGGKDFVPVAVALRGTSVKISPRQLPHTAGGRGLLRVYVNDGSLNTSFAEVRGLSVSRTGWALERPTDPRGG
jgi:hypothetical protein